tara:strand:- start:3140 stop:3430 length:291 start_codon:yes stop_codon:yes gene_type:complete
MENYEFFEEVKTIAKKLEFLIDKYNLRNEVMSILAVGVIEGFDIPNETARMKAMYNFNICDESEIDEICDLIKTEFRSRDKDDGSGYTDDFGFFMN